MYTNLLIGATLVWSGVTGTAAAPRTFDIVPLDPPTGYAQFYPSAINSVGEVAGTAYDPTSDATRAVLWRAGGAVDLGTLGGRQSSANALNDVGVVVGNSSIDDTDSEVHAFEWDGQAMRDLGIPAHTSSATGVSIAGGIVGYEDDHLGTRHALIWERGTSRRLDRFDTGFSHAVAINQAGQVLLTAYLSGAGGSPESFLWNDGVLTRLGAFQATAISNSGQVIGYRATPLPVLEAVRWDHDELRDLSGAERSFLPTSINDGGQMVGSRWSDLEVEQAVLWEGEPRDLNTAIPSGSGWDLWRATAINAAGQIVGYGTFEGQWRGFLLTPPSPENLANATSSNLNTAGDGIPPR